MALNVLLISFLALMGFGSMESFSQEYEKLKADKSTLLLSDVKKFAENARSVDEFLALLPEDYRSEYVLLYKSQSLQSATYSEPRVILYGKDAKIMMTFTGSKQKGSEKIEVLAFDDSANFVPYEIDFGKRKAGQFQQNPNSCTKCHRSDLRPNWESYDFWPGAYGGFDDHVPLNTKESKELSKFIKNAGKKDRYRSLKNLQARYQFDEKTAELPSSKKGMSPNAKLTELIQTLNLKRIMNRLGAEGLPKYKMRLMMSAFLQGCPSGALFSDSEALKAFNDCDRNRLMINQRAKNLIKVTDAALQEIGYSRATLSEYGTADLESAMGDQEFLNRILCFSDEIGFDVSSWSTSFSKDAFNFASPEGRSGVKAFRGAFREAFPELYLKNGCEDLAVKMKAADLSDCKECSRQSQASDLSSDPAQVQSVIDDLQKDSSALVFAKCIKCHTTGEIGPFIDFNNPSQLRSLKSSTGIPLIKDILQRISVEAKGKKKQMPSDSPLNDDERDAITKLLKATP